VSGTRLVEHARAEDLLARAGGFLAAAEAEHNLFFGLLHTLRTAPHLYPRGAWLATLEEGDAVVGTALQTPPHAVLVSRMPPEAIELVARARPDADGVNGPTETVERFAAASGLRAAVHMRQRIYQCGAVEPVPEAPGRARPATSVDDVVWTWRRGFHEEAGEGGAPDEAVQRFRALVDGGGVFLWEDEAPAAMAAATGPTPNGIRVGAVYTPPDRRRRGYATSLVARLTALQLAAGRRFCFLFTDLANPTSNAIYQRIGYRPVCDVTHLRLERVPA
jgi:predicted GNAT family acetyltransferase